MDLLVCNAGSTSLKLKLFEMNRETVLFQARIERVGAPGSGVYAWQDHLGRAGRREGLDILDYETGIRLVLDSMLAPGTGVIGSAGEIGAVSFKTVLARGFYGVHELTEDVMRAMEQYLFVAPVHNAAYLAVIRQFQSLLPHTRMIGVFETAFHTTIPLERRLYAVPYEWYEQTGLARMGYHGASHAYIAQQAAKLGRAERVISCHLGGSSSICAIQNGRSVDTSFGFSLQTGVMHANRCGDADPYIIPFMQQAGLSQEEILEGLSKKGGLLGISGVSNDMRQVHIAAEKGNAHAQLAIDMLVRDVIRYIGSFYAELGGLDQLVFTGGIGENDAFLRAMVCRPLRHMGVWLDEAANNGCRDGIVSQKNSPVLIPVIPANEELGLARQALAYLSRT